LTPTILIITNSGDLHADLVVTNLTEKGVTPFRINLNEFPRDFVLEYASDSDGWSATLTHTPSVSTLILNTVTAIWTRKTSEFAFPSGDQFSTQEKTYAKEETQHVLNSLLYSLDCYWMNHPLAVRSALWKGEQALRATKMGFKTPPSLITNRPEAVVEFKGRVNHDIVLKAMSTSTLAAEKMEDGEQVVVRGLSTTIVTDDMMDSVESVQEIPCYFQAYTDKQFELRVTVIGNHVFAAKIDSQASEKTKVDLRDYSAEIDYEAHTLPPEVEQRCREFVHSYNLQYGAMDIIVTPEGEYVFLENNPAGQFLFVEQLVPEFTMIDTLANCLIAGTP